jgi:RNA polymerase sigma-70 factor (ECF subfamily)
MEAAQARRGGRGHNLSLRQLRPAGGRKHATDRAFERFYREHVAEVYQYALAVLSNPADAEDVTQQTFLNAYRAFQNGERPHTPHNWLIKIAHNVCRMRWRQSARRPQEVPLENAPQPSGLDEEKPSLDEVLSALARLPFNQRAAIVMREVEGRTYQEIAEVMSTTVPAVEALLFRARTNLKSRRKALDVLTLVPVPGSLSTFFGGGGGAVAAGGALIGGEFLLKAAAIVATGVVAGGLGFKTVKAIARPQKPQPQFQLARHHATPVWANPVQRIVRARVAAHPGPARFSHPARALSRHGKLRRAPMNDRRSDSGLAASDSGGGNSAGSPADPVASASSPGAAPAETVRKVVASVPAPTLPPPPVSVPVPVPPPPSLPQVTVTVPTVTVPKLP